MCCYTEEEEEENKEQEEKEEENEKGRDTTLGDVLDRIMGGREAEKA